MNASKDIKIYRFGNYNPELIPAGAGISVVQVHEDISIASVEKCLESCENDDLIILADSQYQIGWKLNAEVFRSQFLDANAEVITGADADFGMDSPLQYFYWKHYPRPDLHFNYLNAAIQIGKAGTLRKLYADLKFNYSYCLGENTVQDLLSRYYADAALGCFEPDIHIKIDHKQAFIACTTFSHRKRLRTGWLHQILFRRNERAFTNSTERAGKELLNVRLKKDSFIHEITQSTPQIVVCRSVSDRVGKLSFSDKLKIETQTLKDVFFIGKVNKWHFDRATIFRHLPNKSTEMQKAMTLILDRLEHKKPLSFAHYNDGELTFIRDFQSGNHHEKWFGRKQQQYNPELAERLLGAMQYKKEGYFIGVPCSVDHPKLRKEADEIVGDYAYKVQAMSIHHNLFFMPRIIHALRGRMVYFFTNEFQDLSFFHHLGIEVHEERVIKVPFRNSYLEYDQYKNMRFPEGAVVILTCGMLAKILTKVWYENHESLTVMALGASLDDHLQKENSGFELFPVVNPVTGNIKKYRYFLFGYKKPCKECFDFSC